jgi:predicted AAA+ superfamily ATPase
MKPRLLYDEIEKYLTQPEAIIITGMRRTGKTTLLRYIYDRIGSDNKVFLDLENPLNRKYFEEENYESIRSSLNVLGVNVAKQAFVFVDEIQFVRNLPSVVKYFIDHYKVKFFLTGSASYYLKNLFAESLAGRKYIFELFPLSFGEFLAFKEININIAGDGTDVSKTVCDLIAPHYEEYITFGGFPGVVLKEGSEEKNKSLDDIFSSFFQLEVLQLGDFRRNNIVRDLMLLLAQRSGSKLDILKLSSELGVSRHTLSNYISFLEGTYFIQTIKPFSRGRDTEIRKMPKIYLCDTGLANRLARLDEGTLFENCVFNNLRLRGEVAYYQKKSGVEIDFVVGKKVGYEVKVLPRTTDIVKLQGLCNEVGLNDCTIISKRYSKLENIMYGFMI